MKILLGTTNPSKVNMFKEFLDGYDVEFITLKDLNISDEPNETGSNPEENARIKAEYYSRYFDCVICHDSGLYIYELDFDDRRQPGLHIKSPYGRVLDEEGMIGHYAALAKELGGRMTCYYLNGIAVYNSGRLSSFIETKDMCLERAFYMVDKVHKKRHPGWPLDSISVNKNTGLYFVEDDAAYDNEKENAENSQYIKSLTEFLVDALELKKVQ